ncbi:hypothetical protein ACFQ0M_04845 [Kitasatospora aburaviensis]
MEGTVEVALRWCDSREERVASYANSRPTLSGGAHEVGFRDGLAAAVNAYAREQQLLTPADPDFTPAQLGAGLTAVVSVKLDHPEFEEPSTTGSATDPSAPASPRPSGSTWPPGCAPTRRRRRPSSPGSRRPPVTDGQPLEDTGSRARPSSAAAGSNNEPALRPLDQQHRPGPVRSPEQPPIPARARGWHPICCLT